MANIERIFIRVQEPDGSWKTKSLKDCSLIQFLRWAIPRANRIEKDFPGFSKLVSSVDPNELKRDFVDWLRVNGEIVYELKEACDVCYS